MKSILTLLVTLTIAAGLGGWETTPSEAAVQHNRITVRTERYPRPPYSGATYYIYERGDEVICTKLEVCNKYDECSTEYRKGSFKEEEDVETGEPYGKTDAVVIPTAKLRKHVCLTRFKLLK
jgi:hypothetical protein